MRSMLHFIRTCGKNGLSNTFNQQKRMAGKDWLYGFLNQHNQLSIRTLEATSIARAVGFNLAKVDRFYDLLEQICASKQLPASHI